MGIVGKLTHRDTGKFPGRTVAGRADIKRNESLNTFSIRILKYTCVQARNKIILCQDPITIISVMLSNNNF